MASRDACPFSGPPVSTTTVAQTWGRPLSSGVSKLCALLCSEVSKGLDVAPSVLCLVLICLISLYMSEASDSVSCALGVTVNIH